MRLQIQRGHYYPTYVAEGGLYGVETPERAVTYVQLNEEKAGEFGTL